jgi:hypothetical protein
MHKHEIKNTFFTKAFLPFFFLRIKHKLKEHIHKKNWQFMNLTIYVKTLSKHYN